MSDEMDVTPDQTQIELGIFGLDKTLAECDEIYWHLDEKHRCEDNALFSLKWFDYRNVHNIHATYLFADAYRTVYREAYAKNFDRERSEHVRGIRGEDIFDFTKKRKVDMTGFVRARQHADLLGMPYIEFCRIAIGWAMRRSRDYVPRPCQLYNFDLLTAIQESWRERQAGQVFVAEDPHFRNDAYEGLSVQDAHHEWVMSQAMLRPNIGPFLARVIYGEQVLLESKARARFGDEAVERARALH